MRNAGVEDFVVEVFERGGLRSKGKAHFRVTAAGGGQARGDIGVIEQNREAGGEGALVARGNQEGGAVLNDGFGNAGAAEGNDGETDSLRFAEDHGQALGVAIGSNDAGGSEYRSAMHEVADDGRRLRSEKGAAGEEGFSLFAQGIEERAIANNEERGGGVGPLDDGHGAEKMGAAFLFDEAADEEDDGIGGAGAERVRREEAEVNADAVDTEFGGRKPAVEGLLADVLGDAEEKAGVGEELGAAAQIDAAGGRAAEGGVVGGSVVAVQGDDERYAEMFVDGEGGSGVEGEVSVQQSRMAETQSAQKMRGEAGLEEKEAADFFGESVAAGEGDGVFRVEREAGAVMAQTGKNRDVAAASVRLGSDEGLGGGQEVGTEDEDVRIHEAS